MSISRHKTKNEQIAYQRKMGKEATVAEARAFVRGAATNPRRAKMIAAEAAEKLPAGQRAAHAAQIASSMSKEELEIHIAFLQQQLHAKQKNANSF